MSRTLEILRDKLTGRSKQEPVAEPLLCANCGAEIRRADPRMFRDGWAHVESDDDICELYAQPKVETRKDAA